jgi:hypothetical protein
MSDGLDFAGLRTEVEAATRLPEFDVVAKRARKIKRRSRLAVLGSVLGVLAIIGPAGVASVLAQPAAGPAGPVVDVGPERPETTEEPMPISSVPPVTTVLAVDGVDLAHAYALVDMCRDTACDLQLVPVLASGSGHASPVRTGLLRRHPTDLLTNFALHAQNATELLVTARDSTGAQVFAQVDAGTDATPSGTASPASGSGSRLWAVQPADGGYLWAFDLHSGKMVTLPSQPPVSDPVVCPGVDPARGIWVTGTASATGALTVAVSSDGGRAWKSQDLGIRPVDAPRLATYDGTHAYLLVRTAQGFVLAATADAGATWKVTGAELPWPQDTAPNTAYGLAVRPDGTVLAWLATTPAVSYLQSADRGLVFRALDNGPGGALYELPDGYVATGVEPKLSRDAATWTPAELPIRLD